MKLARKLLPRFIGPFTVETMVDKAAVRLKLPTGYRIHPTFHVSLIHNYRAEVGRLLLPPVSMLDQSPFRQVDKVIDSETRTIGGKKQRWFFVRWTGCTHLHDSWEPESSFEDSRQVAIKEYF